MPQRRAWRAYETTSSAWREARAVAREMVAFAAMRDELERGGELLLDEKSKGVSRHAA